MLAGTLAGVGDQEKVVIGHILIKKYMPNINMDIIYYKITCIYGHLWWPFFSPFGYRKLLELVFIMFGRTLFKNCVRKDTFQV